MILAKKLTQSSQGSPIRNLIRHSLQKVAGAMTLRSSSSMSAVRSNTEFSHVRNGEKRTDATTSTT
eukprot:scaffold1609_cov94-Skeletonema_dohrnii-CCMP3373.AAC.2